MNVILFERKRIMSSFARHLKAETPRPFQVDLSPVQNPEGFKVTKNETTSVKGTVAGLNFSLTTADHPYINIRITSGGKNIYCDVHTTNLVKVLSAITTNIREDDLCELCEDCED